MWQPTLAAMFALWPIPIGTGYLFLKRWRRFLVVLFGVQMLGVTALHILVGSDLDAYFALAVYVAVAADTWRLARLRYKELKAAQPT